MDKETEKLLVYAGVAVAGYLLYKKIFESPMSNAQGQNALQNAGLNTYNVGSAVYAQAGDTTFKFNEGDFSNLNFAQRFLIGLDRVVPGDWLTKAVLS